MKHLPPSQRRINVSARSGFTLVELLAVGASCALLLAMVVPSLEQARMKSKHAVCLERMSAIGAAQRTYTAEDPHGWAIPVHPLQFFQNVNYPSFIGAYEWGGKSGIGRPGSVPGPGGQLAFLTSKYGTKAGFGPATRPLNPHLYPHGFRNNLFPEFEREGATLDTKLALDAFRCPGDDGPPRGAHCPEWIDFPSRSSFDHFGTSYAANVFMIASAGAGNSMLSNSPYLRPISRVPNPARTFAYEENIGRWAWAARREMCDFIQPGVDPGPTKVVRGWHGRNWVYNQLYVDGHAASAQVLNDGTLDAQGYSSHYLIETVFDDPEIQANQRCLIIRGPGWQKDTLPAPQIVTGLIFNGSGRPSYEDCVVNE